MNVSSKFIDIKRLTNRRRVLSALAVLLLCPFAFAELLPPTPCFQGTCAEAITAEEEATPAPDPSAPGEPAPATPAPSNGNAKFVKWNPGHYGRADTLRGIQTIRTYWANHPYCADPRGDAYIKGLAIRFMWREIETSRGVYDFSKIDEYLDVLQNHCGSTARRLIIGTDHQANNLHSSKPADEGGKMCAPQYIWDQGGVIEWKRRGGQDRCLGRIWIPWVKDRYKALLVAIATRYNDHPMVEMISPKGEGSLGLNGADDTFDRTVYRAAHIEIANAIRAAAPNTSVVLGTNYHGNSHTTMQQYVDYTYDTAGVGWTWPDTFHRPGQPWPMTHTQFYLKPASGAIGPLAAEHQLPSNRGQGSDGYDSAWRHCCDKSSRERTFSELLNKEVDETYAATHSIWMRRDIDSTYSVENLLRVLENRNGEVYSEACPSSWTQRGFSCRTGATL